MTSGPCDADAGWISRTLASASRRVPSAGAPAPSSRASTRPEPRSSIPSADTSPERCCRAVVSVMPSWCAAPAIDPAAMDARRTSSWRRVGRWRTASTDIVALRSSLPKPWSRAAHRSAAWSRGSPRTWRRRSGQAPSRAEQASPVADSTSGGPGGCLSAPYSFSPRSSASCSWRPSRIAFGNASSAASPRYSISSRCWSPARIVLSNGCDSLVLWVLECEVPLELVQVRLRGGGARGWHSRRRARSTPRGRPPASRGRSGSSVVATVPAVRWG